MRSKGGGLVIESRRVETPCFDGEPGELPAGGDKSPARRENFGLRGESSSEEHGRERTETLRIRCLILQIYPRTRFLLDNLLCATSLSFYHSF